MLVASSVGVLFDCACWCDCSLFVGLAVLLVAWCCVALRCVSSVVGGWLRFVGVWRVEIVVVLVVVVGRRGCVCWRLR